MRVVVGGKHLSAVAPWGDLEWSTCLQGSDELSWRMTSTRHPRLRGRQKVTLYDSTRPVWAGQLAEPDDESGVFKATGLWNLAADYPALDGSGVVTMVPNTAIDASIARGLPWKRVASISAVAVSTDTLGEVPSLMELLDAWADTNSKRWAVNADGEVYGYTDPTSPDWHVTPGGSLAPASDGYVTRLFGRRRTSAGGYDTVTRPATVDPLVEARWGHKYETVDLTGLGYLTAGQAENILDGILAKGRGRLGWANSLNLTRYQILNDGGIPAHLPLVRAGALMRVHGLWDDTRDLHGKTHVDVLIGRTIHRAAEPTVEVQPNQLAAVTLPLQLDELRKFMKNRR